MMKLMMRMMNLVLPTCEEVSRLASQSMDETLSWKKRLGVRLHLWMCVWCRRSAGQMKLMRSLSHCASHTAEEDVRLSDSARERIARALKQDGPQAPDA